MVVTLFSQSLLLTPSSRSCSVPCEPSHSAGLGLDRSRRSVDRFGSVSAYQRAQRLSYHIADLHVAVYEEEKRREEGGEEEKKRRREN